MNAKMIVHAALVLVLGAAASACSGSGGSGAPFPGGATTAGATSASQVATVPMNVSLRPSATSVATGQTIDVALSATQVKGLYGAGVDLVYDPALLEPKAVTGGKLLGGATVGSGLRGGTPGVLTVACSAEGASAGASGTGDVLIVSFLAKAPGLATVRPEHAILEDAAGNQGASLGLVGIAVAIR